MSEEFIRQDGTNQEFTSTIKPNLNDKDRFSQTFNVLLNYWEIKPSLYESKLQELTLNDVRVVSAFIPWAHIETDIYHSLKKFVRAAVGMKMKVRLFVMPELGVNYPNAGIPKDLISSNTNLATDRHGRVIYNLAAPNVFPLPSFSSTEVLKRYGNYLIKVSAILKEVMSEIKTENTDGSEFDFCDVIVSNSLFNYYRGYGLKPSEHGDYSASNVMAFRDFLDREYKGVSGGENENFKMQVYEVYNRHRYAAYVERLLREKTDMVFSRRSLSWNVRHLDLFSPDSAVESTYSSLISEALDFKPSIESFFQKIIGASYRGETVFLTNNGVFRRFADQDKLFLVLASLIHGGEVSMHSEDLFKLSPQVHRKLRNLVTFLGTKDFFKLTQVTYLSAGKFSMEEKSFELLSRLASHSLSISSGVDSKRPAFEKLVFVDPKTILRSVELLQLMSIAQAGKVVAIPMPMDSIHNYTAEAFGHYQKFKKSKNALKLNLGLPYEVYEYQLGHVVFYEPLIFWKDMTDTSANPDFVANLSRFFQTLLGLAEARSLCNVSDKRISVCCYVAANDASQKLLFLMNPTNQEIQAKLQFNENVKLMGLPQFGANDSNCPIIGKVFELPVPSKGVLTMQLGEPSYSEIDGNSLKPEDRGWI